MGSHVTWKVDNSINLILNLNGTFEIVSNLHDNSTEIYLKAREYEA